MRVDISSLCMLCFLVTGALGETVFKAESPEDPDDQKKYNFGSIWSGKDDFFKKHVNKRPEDTDVSLQAKQVSSESITKKDQVWEIALRVLKMFPLTYANKEAGVIKTDESYVHEFDNTDSCKYKVTLNISKDGEVAVHITSSDDSQTRITKHEELLKSRIVEPFSETGKTPSKTKDASIVVAKTQQNRQDNVFTS